MSTVVEMYEQLRKQPDADEMDFHIQRPPEKTKAGETISAEGVEDLTVAIRTFILARLGYHWETHEGGFKSVGPQVVRASVSLTIDDVHNVPGEETRPWFSLRSYGITNGGG